MSEIIIERTDMSMNKNRKWLSLITSVGVGAVTYYAMSKQGHSMNQMIKKVAPFVSDMSNSDM